MIEQSCYLTREVRLVDSPNSSVAYEIEKANFQMLTLIDMTVDLNQNKWLGLELADTLIYFDNTTKPNALLSVMGCVKAPHTLIFACDLSTIQDYFKKIILIPRLQRIANHLSEQKTLIVKDGVDNNNLPQLQTREASSLASVNFQLLEKRAGIVHLVGERGSGKSTSLGRLLAQLLEDNSLSLLLSSPSRATSHNTFKVIYTYFSKHHVNDHLTFATPQELLDVARLADFIIVDEAATYPKQVIAKLIDYIQTANKKLILSTTIEGYEGTGQSYRLTYLDNQESDIIYLDTPKRFSIDDPIYQLSQSLYKPKQNILTTASRHDDGIYILSTTELRDKGWTAACFSLLRDAHYKTTPNDLARFYNDPAVFVIVVRDNKIIGAIYALREKLPNTINRNDIFNGVRRAKDALTHQALIHAYSDIAFNKKFADFKDSTILRISRIATDKVYRRQSIATDMIQALIKYAVDNDYTYLSTSFSASKQNIQFWQAQHFQLVRIGLYPNKNNHEYAMLMLYGLSNVSRETIKCCCANFARHVNHFRLGYPSWYWDYFSEIENKPTSYKQNNAEVLGREIDSVITYYRDINWALPALAEQITTETKIFKSLLSSEKMRNKSTKVEDIKLLATMRECYCKTT